MIFGYEMFKNRMQRFSEEKVKNVISGSWYGNTIIAFVIYLFAFDILNVFVARVNVILFYVLYILLLTILAVYIGTRKSGIAISDNRVIYVKFKHIGYREKEVYEVDFDKIKYLNVRKIFFITMVNMSFISNTGRLTRIKALFGSTIVGPGSTEFKRDSKIIYDKLVEIQKVLDKGDF